MAGQKASNKELKIVLETMCKDNEGYMYEFLDDENAFHIKTPDIEGMVWQDSGIIKSDIIALKDLITAIHSEMYAAKEPTPADPGLAEFKAKVQKFQETKDKSPFGEASQEFIEDDLAQAPKQFGAGQLPAEAKPLPQTDLVSAEDLKKIEEINEAKTPIGAPELPPAEERKKTIPEQYSTKPAPKPHTAPELPTPDTQPLILDTLLDIFDADVLEIYGDTGVGKTVFCMTAAEQAARARKTVIYIDTEKNVGRRTKERLKSIPGYRELKVGPNGIRDMVKGPGFYYVYTPILAELTKLTQNMPDADLVIIDSLGMPVLVKWSRMGQNQQGHALQEMIAIKGDLKEWAYRSNGLAIDTNQPVSEMNKSKQDIADGLPPFGDKSGFATKSVMRFIKASETPDKTEVRGVVRKTRDSGKGTPILNMTITSKGPDVRFCIKEVTA